MSGLKHPINCLTFVVAGRLSVFVVLCVAMAVAVDRLNATRTQVQIQVHRQDELEPVLCRAASTRVHTQ